ncbi:MAG: cation diffusion facilitator family transporter [Desulfonatronovibrio sp.]|nr:cation diffusion facilitator family transporter [Desulfovibrionales bacterium]
MSHDHSHETMNYNRAFALGVGLNVLLVIAGIGFGLLAGSLALIADAGHTLSDVISLLLAWGATWLAATAATKKRTYGLRKATVMASLASAILLLVALGIIVWEAVGRFLDPRPVEGGVVIVVSVIGVIINAIAASLFFKGQKNDLNIRGAFLHMAADAGISAGVVVAGILILTTGWLWIDPLISLIIVVVVFVATWRLLKDSMDYALDAVPSDIDISGVQEYLLSHDRVSGLHDLHVWPLSTTEVALTAHIMVDDDTIDNAFLSGLQQHLHDHFRIGHATIQVETSQSENQCLLGNVSCTKKS